MSTVHTKKSLAAKVGAVGIAAVALMGATAGVASAKPLGNDTTVKVSARQHGLPLTNVHLQLQVRKSRANVGNLRVGDRLPFVNTVVQCHSAKIGPDPLPIIGGYTVHQVIKGWFDTIVVADYQPIVLPAAVRDCRIKTFTGPRRVSGSASFDTHTDFLGNKVLHLVGNLELS